MDRTDKIVAVGFIAWWFMIGMGLSDKHETHIKNYKECIKLGTPQQTCLDKYLLPQGSKP